MKALICSLLLAGLGFAGTDEIPQRAGSIALYSGFAHEPPAVVRAVMEDELEAIMGPMGFRFEWRNLDLTKKTSPTAELAVITFKGRCDVTALNAHERFNAGALGWTHISDGQILPFADVDCNEIRGFLQRTLLRLPASQREEAFGRAMGRVLAHELYHIFADTTRHGSCGVAKESYTVDDLMSSTFRFEARESRELRNSKVSVALESAAERH
ncbi:MAG TPA: hypothetical protein VML19_27375 [Verrucomicrobiae bacterium]|nr:hypothetical protein [Verrucomicrobiae bacterium]